MGLLAHTRVFDGARAPVSLPRNFLHRCLPAAVKLASAESRRAGRDGGHDRRRSFPRTAAVASKPVPWEPYPGVAGVWRPCQPTLPAFLVNKFTRAPSPTKKKTQQQPRDTRDHAPLPPPPSAVAIRFGQLPGARHAAGKGGGRRLWRRQRQHERGCDAADDDGSDGRDGAPAVAVGPVRVRVPHLAVHAPGGGHRLRPGRGPAARQAQPVSLFFVDFSLQPPRPGHRSVSLLPPRARRRKKALPPLNHPSHSTRSLQKQNNSSIADAVALFHLSVFAYHCWVWAWHWTPAATALPGARGFGRFFR